MRSSPLLTLITQHQMIPKHSTVFLGVSGGADSIYLLHRLYQLQDMLQFSLVALHFNHQLRGAESQRDEDFVRQFVAKFCPGVPLFIETAPVAQLASDEKMGIEEMARQCRYTFFQSHADSVPNSRIATAHTADDNGETVLMNLVRGAGLRGLAGIPPVRDNIIRPLLTTTRGAIDDYLERNSLPHVEDSSNSDMAYTRNRVRHQIIPVLTEQNPNFLKNIAALTPLLREEDAILDQLSAQQLPPLEVADGRISLSAAALFALPRPLALRAIGQLAQRISPQLVLERDHRTQVLALCAGASPSATLSLPQGLTVRREYDRLVFTTLPSPILATTALTLPLETSVGGYHISATWGVYPGGGTPWSFWIRGDISALTLRPRQVGDRLRRPNRPEKSVKSLMIDAKVPRHLRDSLPVLWAEGVLVAVVGLGVNQSALPAAGEGGWHIQIETIRKDDTLC